MAASAEAAIAKGLGAICFTDHCDLFHSDQVGVYYEPGFAIWERGYPYIEEARALWGDQIEIFRGMELSEIAQDPVLAAEYASAPGIDFLLGSAHTVTGEIEFRFLEYPNLEMCHALVDRYFDENILMAEADLADVIAHIGYYNRYMAEQGMVADLMEHEEKMRHLFDILIQNGRGIELNTSGMRQLLGAPFPTLPVLKVYKDCGGEIITVGTDAHRAEDVGSHIDEAYALLEAAGFRYTTIFRQRKPEFIKI